MNNTGADTLRPVWARENVYTLRCPKSVITPDSLRWLDEFDAWKTLGPGNPFSLNAKSADAIALLNIEFRKELAREETK